MRARVLALAGVVVLATGSTHAAVRYPLILKLDAQLKSGATTISTTVTLRVDRAMDDGRRARVTDALKFGGYSNFLNALRAVPAVGAVETQSGKVDLRYTREEQDGTSSRLILVADNPLFFLNRDPSKPRTGYELTLVDLKIDAQGGVTGTLAGAARVRPAPDGSVLLDTYAEELVQLKGQAGKP